jgi:hypothetical protein
MRRKVVYYSEQTGNFVMECGHTSPAIVSRNINTRRMMSRFQHGTLYRDCSMCQRRRNRNQPLDPAPTDEKG